MTCGCQAVSDYITISRASLVSTLPQIPSTPNSFTKYNHHTAVTTHPLHPPSPQVLSQCYSSALLLVTPHTGVKHQIRSHLGLALNCPVFADHKYSSATRMLPQVGEVVWNQIQKKRNIL